jgi:hypothetical protein
LEKDMVKRALGKRNFPGRLTLDEWLTVSYRARIDLIWRAQCDLLGSFRFCAANPCRRARTCCGDNPEACRRQLWRLKKTMPKTVRNEWARLDRLKDL